MTQTKANWIGCSSLLLLVFVATFAANYFDVHQQPRPEPTPAVVALQSVHSRLPPRPNFGCHLHFFDSYGRSLHAGVWVPMKIGEGVPLEEIKQYAPAFITANGLLYSLSSLDPTMFDPGNIAIQYEKARW